MKTIEIHRIWRNKGWFLFTSQWILWITVLVVNVSCDDFVDIPAPKDELVSPSVFTDDESANAVVRGMYSQMASSLGFAGGYYNSVTVTSSLAADELFSFRPPNAFFENELNPDDQAIERYLWNEAYQYIYTCNVILEQLALSDQLSAEVVQQLEGEARFIRAFCYFYLTNLFGDVPLHLVSDYEANATAERAPKDQVYQQIIEDLRLAKEFLAMDYSWSEGERVRPNKWAAIALLARVYLYTENWEQAQQMASAVLSNSRLYELEPDLTAVFLKNSKEAIWQLRPVRPRLNTLEAFWFIPVSSRPTSVGITDTLLSAFSTEDQRLTQWIGSVSDGEQTWYYPHKFKVRISSELIEYSMVIRLAELYLIRAEASAHLNDFSAAQQDINRIRSRAGLEDITTTDLQQLLDAIYSERQRELFTEWGHRWLDLKRTQRADQILGGKTGWEPTDVLYPIPLNELLRNTQLEQNPGY
ncbi:SusD family protein [Zhouia amylolytica]|uniref:SusD family protein n=2 Tax=Zhouia amylolytica TaxID=376730 RepID=A0A1I6T3N7_9FLAO|nr:SusD family protein [Zhouia amylolytica]